MSKDTNTSNTSLIALLVLRSIGLLITWLLFSYVFDKNMYVVIIATMNHLVQLMPFYVKPRDNIKALFKRIQEIGSLEKFVNIYDVKSVKLFHFYIDILFNIVLMCIFLQFAESRLSTIFVILWTGLPILTSTFVIYKMNTVLPWLYEIDMKSRILDQKETLKLIRSPKLLPKKKWQGVINFTVNWPEDINDTQKAQLTHFFLHCLKNCDERKNAYVGQYSDNQFLVYYDNMIAISTLEGHLILLDRYNKVGLDAVAHVLTDFDSDYFKNKTDGIISYEYGCAYNEYNAKGMLTLKQFIRQC